MKYKNTLQKGSVRNIIFKEGNTWLGVALEFNIVESGDDPKIALINLFDAMQGYVESCQKIKGSRISPLNQKPAPEYEKLWSVANAPKKVKSPFQINTYGVATV